MIRPETSLVCRPEIARRHLGELELPLFLHQLLAESTVGSDDTFFHVMKIDSFCVSSSGAVCAKSDGYH